MRRFVTRRSFQPGLGRLYIMGEVVSYDSTEDGPAERLASFDDISSSIETEASLMATDEGREALTAWRNGDDSRHEVVQSLEDRAGEVGGLVDTMDVDRRHSTGEHIPLDEYEALLRTEAARRGLPDDWTESIVREQLKQEDAIRGFQPTS